MKLFNKQRFQFIERKRLKSYLTYAFGEIILVVVGILIAVSINSYFNKKNLDDSNQELKSQVIVQLEKDIKHIEEFEQELNTLNQAYLKVLDRPHDASKLNSNSVVATLLLNIKVLSLGNSATNLIDNAQLNNSKDAKNMLNLSSSYKLYLKSIDDTEAIIFKAISDNLKAIEDSEDWYVEFITDFNCTPECFTFLTTSKEHKARMASLRFLYVNVYNNILNNFKTDLKWYLKTLKS